MASVDFVFGSLNVHRADCNRDHHHPCDSWTERAPRVAATMHDDMRCSVYALQECMPAQAHDLMAALGWGDATNPAGVTDENQNSLIYDRGKWTDRGVLQVSLTGEIGDTGDKHRRSILWTLLVHLDSGKEAWFGSGHLENGDADERAREAEYLVDHLPPGALVMGLDRNSYTTSEDQPRDIFERAGFEELEPDNDRNERSFNSWDYDDTPYDGKSIDGQHYRGGVAVRDGAMIYTTDHDSTDHNGLVGKLTLT